MHDISKGTSAQASLEERLSHIENKLVKVENVTEKKSNGSSFSNGGSDEIDLRKLWSVLWQKKWWIVATTFICALASIAYALSLPNMYKSEGVYAPAQREQGVGGLAAKYGGIAAMAGISLGGGESTDIEQAIELLKSWPFLESFINKYSLKPEIMAVKEWDAASGTIIWDEDKYDAIKKLWVREPPPGKLPEPSSYEVYRAFREMLTVSNDVKTGLIKIGIEHYSPIEAAKWTNLLVNELNKYFQNRDMREAKKNIDYLELKIKETRIAEMQTVFYGMIEEQTKTLMLAEVGEEYLIKTVVAPKVAEMKSKPKRSLIVILGTMVGGMLSVLGVLIFQFLKGESE